MKEIKFIKILGLLLFLFVLPSCTEDAMDSSSTESDNSIASITSLVGLNLIWPLSGTTTPDTIQDTYGSRMMTTDNDRYDFHRGLDLPADKGTPVFAVA